MAIAFANLGASANPDLNETPDASSYATASWTPPTSDLIIVGVGSRATAVNTPTISGNSLTWVEIATITVASVHRLTLFGANASGSSAGVTTIAFGGQTQLHCVASFFQATGVDLTGGVLAAFVQAPTNTGTNVQTLSVNLAAAGHADNRPISLFYHAQNEATTHRTNWTELDDLFGPGRALESQYRDDAFETTASSTWATPVVAAGIAAELKAAGGGGGGGTAVPVFVHHMKQQGMAQ